MLFSSIKEGMRFFRNYSFIVVMALSWSSSLESSRPLDRSSCYLTIDARRLFVSNKNPRHLVPGWLKVDPISKVKVDWWFHTLEGRFNCFPLNGIFGDSIIFVAEMYQGEGEIPLQDARRGFAMLPRLHVFLAKSLFFLNVPILFPFGSNKICIYVTAIELTYLL